MFQKGIGKRALQEVTRLAVVFSVTDYSLFAAQCEGQKEPQAYVGLMRFEDPVRHFRRDLVDDCE